MRRFWGYLSVIIATMLFGLWNTFSKILLNYLNPLTLSAIVYTIAGVFLFLVYFSPLNEKIISKLDKNSQSESFITRKEYGILIITAILGAFLAPFIYLNGLNQITAVNASLLMNVEILFVVIIGIFFLKERFVKADILGFLFIITGTIFLATNGQITNFSPGQVIGTLLIVSAAFLWSIDTSLSKFISKKRELLLVSAIKCSIGGFSLLFLSLIFGQSFALPLNKLPYLLFIGLIIVGFSFILVYFAIKKIGSTRTGSLFSLASLFGAIFAFLILGESFTFTQLFFGFLMLLGVYVFYINESNYDAT